jgi:hypothetical protein
MRRNKKKRFSEVITSFLRFITKNKMNKITRSTGKATGCRREKIGESFPPG